MWSGPPEGSKYWGDITKMYVFWSIFIRFSKFFFSLKAVDRANYWGGQAAPPAPPVPVALKCTTQGLSVPKFKYSY